MQMNTYRTNMNKQKYVNVLGTKEPVDTIRCEYRNCYHMEEEHLTRSHGIVCQCHHFRNKALGVQTK
jgi:hypothetical protein